MPIINNVKSTMKVYPSKDECCGCTACENICSKSAIRMEADEEGFVYPKIDDSLCVNCNACIRVCAFQHEVKTEGKGSPIAYAVRHINLAELKLSRSGGMFVAISDYILDNGGAVYGAGFSDHFLVVHKRTTTKIGRDEFRGSKYVQSEMLDCFQLVKLDLKQGKQVLFSGTPCQTAGLNSYLGALDKSNLVLCDIVCHGVPSPKLWKDYLHYIESKYGKQITAVQFRDKELGWNTHFESFQFLGSVKKVFRRTYTELFYSHFILRPSCEKCKYTNLQRPSDITLADLWGWEKVCPSFNVDNAGVSLVLINTLKGQDVFDRVQKDISYVGVDIKDCMQTNLVRPTKFPIGRKEFWGQYQRFGFRHIAARYSDVGSMRFILVYLKKIVTKINRLITGSH